jgi:hypothetical protein
MKKYLALFFCLTGFYTLISQTKVPQLVSFSAVVRNANNTPLANTSVSLRLTFRKLGQTGPVVYCALHQQTTNANGYITLQLNRQVLGTACNGAPFTAFENIPWEEGGFWMDVEYQTTPTTPFVSLGQLELASTFYSFVSKYAENVKGLSLGTANNDDVLTYESATNTWKAKPVSSTVGLQGPAGPAGAQGPQGIAGPAGNNGVSITNTQIQNDSLKITLSNNTTINAGYVKGAKGDTGVQGPAGLLPNGTTAGNTAFWNGTQWVVNNSNIHNNGASIGIGTTNPNPSAKLEIVSTTQGFLPPRMTTAQRNAISSPSAGLTIYNTTVNCLQWWNGNVWFDGCGNNPHLQYPAGSIFCASGATAVVDVTNPTTGKTWMDRNLGATRAAISSTDTLAYGDLYQWGRRNDGHQCRNSDTTFTPSSIDQPAHGNFITITNGNLDWRAPQNTNLWQGVNGMNNPCPTGYRLPTETELEAERLSWSQNNSAGAFASPLKLPVAGYRSGINGSLIDVSTYGFYWSSTNSTYSRGLRFGSTWQVTVMVTSINKHLGLSVRCLKDIIGTVGAINCGSVTNTGTLTAGTAASGVSSSVPYTGGNGGTYNGQSISSTGVTGLTATLSAGSLLNGNGSISYTITGTPSASGTASFLINLGGQSCSFSLSVTATSSYPAGSVFCASGATAVVDVTNPLTGKTWMDRNLGASRVAISKYDTAAYGDLYQWGRRSDGHQCRNSAATTTLSSIDQPGHSNFIVNSNNIDWRSPQNSNLWQGLNGINNPCPSGYRLPTEIELDNERLSWSSQNSPTGVFASSLKLPETFFRYGYDGTIDIGGWGYYWSSSVSGTKSHYLKIASPAIMGTLERAFGFSVRCIKN